MAQAVSIASEQASLAARFQSVLDNSVDGFIAIDESGTILHFNKGACAMFGYDQSEVVGKNVKILMPASMAGRHDGYLQAYRETGERRYVGRIREETCQRRDGKAFPVELAVSQIDLPEGRIYSGIIRDISHRKQLEKDLLRRRSELERSNRDLEEFAYIASHDLKEPLRAIDNHVRFLWEDHAEALGEAGRSRIERMQQLCGRADRIISDLLRFSRLGREGLASEPHCMGRLVQEAIEPLADRLAESNATVTAADNLPVVEGDRPRLVSLLQNLILNGVKYNDAEEKRIEIGWRAEADPIFFVRDNGIGIPPSLQDSVFTLFKRLNSEQAYGPGSGAGLTFARKIVERHGGRMWLESEPGLGSTFFFTIPGDTRCA